MQATVSKKSSAFYYVAAVGVFGALTVASIALVMTGFGGVGQSARSNTEPAAAPQAIVTSDALYANEASHDMARTRGQGAGIITSDEAFTLEAVHDMTRTHGASAQILTSDALYALEAIQMARQQAVQASKLFITSDEAFAFEQTLAELNRR